MVQKKPKKTVQLEDSVFTGGLANEEAENTTEGASGI